ncbi:MAG TPA: NAD(P)H-dependent glycerol-3-phosphate dehydrogenase [Gaiellales bacterium]|nr:NAD(P)H-dependent glycerol-3-phosphate dehydrogenase [Gaiellales bacterium]
MRVFVVGCGSWGTAFGRLLALQGHAPTLVCRDASQADAIARHRRNPRHLYDVELPDALGACALDGADMADADLVALAVPSRAFAEAAAVVVPRAGERAALLSMTKGLDPGSRRRLSEILADLADPGRVAVLSGPNHAEEVARDQPTASVVASESAELARTLQRELSGRTMRVYASRDVVGVELCAASKNVIAIAAGISDGLGYGDNAKAAIITRGMAEMSRLGEGFGASPRTYMGMAGMGDLVATCTSHHSRNRRAGEMIATGVPTGWIEQEIGEVAEGLTAAPVLRDVARERGIELPITEAVCSVAFGGVKPLDALAGLMAREPVEE